MNRELRVSAALLVSVVALAGCTEHGSKDAQRPSAAVSVPAPVPSVPEVPPASPSPSAWIQADDGMAPETSVVPAPSSVAPSPRTSTSAAPVKPSTRPATTAPAPKPPTTTAAPVKPTATAPQGNTIRIGSWVHGYVTAYGSQSALDRCNVVEWDDRWFAGHDWCGYAFWANLGVGQTITLTGPHAGTYTVTNRVYLPTQGGKAPELPAFDLVFQTCKGSGTELILARKTG